MGARRVLHSPPCASPLFFVYNFNPRFPMKNIAKKFALCISGICAFAAFAAAADYTVKSPDGTIEGIVRDSRGIYLTVKADGKTLVENARLGLLTDRGELGGADAKIVSQKSDSVDTAIEPVYGIRSRIRDNFNQTDFDFGNYVLSVRAYNEAVAYRFVSKLGGGKMAVFKEIFSIPAADADKFIAHAVKADESSFEEYYLPATADELKTRHSLTLPLILERCGMKVAVVESGVSDYPDLRFVAANGAMEAYQSRCPKTLKRVGKDLFADEKHPYIAHTDASREFPWRALIVARSDADLADNDTVYKLAPASKIANTKWIKPGLCLWDWWSYYYLSDVPFKPGINNETYRYFVDFAAATGVPYLLIDEGWVDGRSVYADILIPEGRTRIDVKAVIDYAHSKKVKVFLWILTMNLYKNCDAVLDRIGAWGADGIKVDFFDRDDQASNALMERIASAAAERRLLVDFHGCPKPSGLQRTYPNVLNFEGVKGNEFNKAVRDFLTPEHNIDIVFTRMLQGPMDFTPGAMRNVLGRDFARSHEMPVAWSTRSNQIAMFIAYYAPLQMACDSPSEYIRAPEDFAFISKIPASWDETKVLEAEFGKKLVIARRSGNVWFIGGMNGSEPRGFEVSLADLPFTADKVKVEIFSDGEKTAEDAKFRNREVKIVPANAKLVFKAQVSGGFAVRAEPVK